MKKAIVSFMPFAFQNVNDIALDFWSRKTIGIYNSKIILECIKLYKTLLKKRKAMNQ